jgi:hypothetical protein
VAGLNKVAIEAEGTCYINPLDMFVEILLQGIFRPFTACSSDNGEHKECFSSIQLSRVIMNFKIKQKIQGGGGRKPSSKD